MKAPIAELRVSTVSLQSNVYPVVNEVPYHDKAFLNAIHDPELLRIFDNRFKGRYHLSQLQNDERLYAIPCIHAEEGDFPWGTIASNDGEMIACRCENYECGLFTECRPEVAVSETEELGRTRKIAPTTEAPLGEEIVIPDIETFNKAFYESLENTPPKAERKEREGIPESIIQESEPEHDTGDFDFDFDFDFDLDETPQEDEDGQGENWEKTSRTLPSEIIDEKRDHENFTPTEEQLRIITFPADARAIVNAGPGTGKTFTLIEKLKYMLEDQEVPSESILVLSFSRAAVNVIEDRLSAAVSNGQLTVPWQSLDIRTFDKFATWILYCGADMKPSDVPESFLPNAEEISRFNYDQRILAAKNLIANWGGLFDNVAHVFIDETQDLVSHRADLVLAILNSLPEDCGFTLLGDSCQAIYDYSLYTRERGKRIKRGTTSTDMLNIVRDLFNPVEFCLTVNHRIKGSIPYSLETLRSALMNEEAQVARDSIQRIIELYNDNLEEIRELDRTEIEASSANGTLGILTRTNGEALYVSSLLRNKSISHRLRQADRDEFVSRVIADVFYDYNNDSIDRKEFVSRAIRAGAGTEEECTEGWYELAEACRGKEFGARYLVEDILRCFTSNAKHSAFFTSTPDDNGITVGTIHSAKGREYDVVWLASDDLEKVAKKDDLDEYKVAYVALSRPVSSLELKRFETASRIMGFADPTTSKRRNFCVPRSIAMGTSRTKKKRVSNIEPIDEVDIDFGSFGSKSAIQNALRKLCEPGDPLSLLKNPAAKGAYPTYTICLESDEGQRPLGLMKPSFAKAFTISTSSINGGKKEGHSEAHYIDDCPEAFDDLYVEDVITCIGGVANAPKYAKRFGNQCVWYGLTITGLAKVNNRSY